MNSANREGVTTHNCIGVETDVAEVERLLDGGIKVHGATIKMTRDELLTMKLLLKKFHNQPLPLPVHFEITRVLEAIEMIGVYGVDELDPELMGPI